MGLQLYQVDQKSYLLDFKSLNFIDHPDAKKVARMTKEAMHLTSSKDSGTKGMYYNFVSSPAFTLLLFQTFIKGPLPMNKDVSN